MVPIMKAPKFEGRDGETSLDGLARMQTNSVFYSVAEAIQASYAAERLKREKHVRTTSTVSSTMGAITSRETSSEPPSSTSFITLAVKDTFSDRSLTKSFMTTRSGIL